MGTEREIRRTKTDRQTGMQAHRDSDRKGQRGGKEGERGGRGRRGVGERERGRESYQSLQRECPENKPPVITVTLPLIRNTKLSVHLNQGLSVKSKLFIMSLSPKL